jgi:hypothetical protein
VSRRFDQQFQERGYTGPKPEMRPDFCREAEKQHKRFLAGKGSESPLLSATQFIQLHAFWLDERNRTQPHTGCGMNGRTAMEAMDELLPVEQRRIPDMAELLPLFWDVQKRIVSNCKVQLNNSTYSAAPNDPEGQQQMYFANSGTVAVHCDPNDISCALAFEDKPGGRFLARVFSDELAAQGPLTAEQVKAMARQRAKVFKSSKDAMNAITSAVPSEIELLERRAGIAQRATGTDGAASPRAANPFSLPSLGPAFVSDAVKRDADTGIWDHVESEED